jgi:hypothetical protein
LAWLGAISRVYPQHELSFKTTFITSMFCQGIAIEFKKQRHSRIHFEKYCQNPFKQYLYCLFYWALFFKCVGPDKR